MSWFSVYDSLPDADRDVLIVVKTPYSRRQYMARLHDGDWIIGGMKHLNELEQATHWCNLPPLPKEG